MIARVPRAFSFPARTGIASGKPVRYGQHAQIGRALNYLAGRGTVLVPAMRTNNQLAAKNATTTYRFQLWGKAQATHRLWWVSLVAQSGSCYCTFTDPSGGTINFTAMTAATTSARMVTGPGIYHLETVSSPADGPTAATVSIYNDNASASDVLLDGISCFEIPRLTLDADATENGIGTDTIQPDAPIFDDVGLSIGGMSRAVAKTLAYDPRTLFQWALGDNNGVAISAGAWAEVFEEGPVIQPSHLYRSETTRAIRCYVYARSDAATTADVKFTATSGANCTVSIPGGSSGGWYSADMSPGPYAEDLSTSDGRRSTTTEILKVEVSRTAGAGNAYLESISVGELRT